MHATVTPCYPEIPAILVGRLVRDANTRCVRVASEIAASLIVVDSKGEAATRFYEKFGFMFSDSKVANNQSADFLIAFDARYFTEMPSLPKTMVLGVAMECCCHGGSLSPLGFPSRMNATQYSIMDSLIFRPCSESSTGWESSSRPLLVGRSPPPPLPRRDRAALLATCSFRKPYCEAMD